MEVSPPHLTGIVSDVRWRSERAWWSGDLSKNGPSGTMSCKKSDMRTIGRVGGSGWSKRSLVSIWCGMCTVFRTDATVHACQGQECRLVLLFGLCARTPLSQAIHLVLQRSGPRLHPEFHSVGFCTCMCKKTMKYQSLSLVVLLVPDCAWNHVRCLFLTASGWNHSVNLRH